MSKGKLNMPVHRGWIVVALVLVLCLGTALSASAAEEARTITVNTIDPTTIPQFVNQLTGPPPVYVPNNDGSFTVTMSKLMQQILPPPFPKTEVWGYGGKAKDAVTGNPLGVITNSPGPSFEAKRGKPVQVKWVNKISTPHLFAVDPTIHWANPNNMVMPSPPFNPFPPGYAQAESPVPLVTHLHGGETPSTSDGGPEQWFTQNGIHGPDYSTDKPTSANAAVYTYPNEQRAATLWYHDHALGMTRLNVMSGLAGFYLLRDSKDPIAPLLPNGKYEVPLAIQDRIFNENGSLFFPTEGNVPEVHPYWQPEFFGDTIMVNGLVWPNMNVNRATYRFRLLDGSNARFYTLTFDNGMSFTQIGTDGGYLKSPVTLKTVTLAPGERADILVDFSKLAPGTKVVLKNSAPTPFPDGDPPVTGTTDTIMQFTVKAKTGPGMPVLPALLNPTLVGPFPNLPSPDKTRVLILWELLNQTPGPTFEESMGVFLDGKMWDSPISEFPEQGSTEDWKIVDTTGDTHPIHLHLVQFQLVSRQRLNISGYLADWLALNGQPPFMNQVVTPLDPTPYLKGSPRPPAPNEMGWKDTIQMNPGEVTIIRARWAQQDGLPYGFDATKGPGYVWHCHIIDHEDNEMMRPYKVV